MIGLPLLAGCTQLRDGAYKASRDVEREAQQAGKKISDYIQIKPMQEAPPSLKPVPPIYCYRVMQDVVCYNQPVAGSERRLVGKQGMDDITLSPPVNADMGSSGTSLRSKQGVKLEDVKPVYVPSMPKPASDSAKK